MGKFVQLSTQIRTYRNCRGGGWERQGFECMHTQTLRGHTTLEMCKKNILRVLRFAAALGEYLGLKEKLLPAYYTGLS